VGDVKDAIQHLISTMQFLATVLIWIVIYILPVLLALYLILVLPLTLVLRFFRKRRAQRKATQINTITPPEPPQASV
jgi:Flp pilus assembly protein TadB